jgi:hypothetical protein
MTPTIHGQDLGLLRSSDLLAEPISMTKMDVETNIIKTQRKNGSGPILKIKDGSPDVWVWSDWQAVQLFAFSSGSFVGIGSSAIGFFS